jgi:hypothetical protein
LKKLLEVNEAVLKVALSSLEIGKSATLLHRLDTDIVPEVPFKVLIQTEGDTSLVSGKMGKAALRFNSIDRWFWLSYKDKNFTTE